MTKFHPGLAKATVAQVPAQEPHAKVGDGDGDVVATREVHAEIQRLVRVVEESPSSFFHGGRAMVMIVFMIVIID